MREVLNGQQQEILKNRVYIARQIKIFDLKDISEHWKISIASIFRYNSPHLRESSRKYSRKVWDIERTRDKSVCQICFDPLKGHERCPICTQLTHDYSRHIH